MCCLIVQLPASWIPGPATNRPVKLGLKALIVVPPSRRNLRLA
jgi:hypothetical protein